MLSWLVDPRYVESNLLVLALRDIKQLKNGRVNYAACVFYKLKCFLAWGGLLRLLIL